MADYTLERTAGQCRFILSEDLTASIIPSLRMALKQELDQGMAEAVFDLRNTAMVDSSGIGLLIATHNSLSVKRGNVRVTGASPAIVNLLQSMRLVARLNVTGREQGEVQHG